MRYPRALLATLASPHTSVGHLIWSAMPSSVYRRFAWKQSARELNNTHSQSVFANPMLVDRPDGYRVEVMEPLASDLVRNDKAGVSEQAQMLHRTESRHM